METNKIVINCCHGGFSLSLRAVKWLAFEKNLSAAKAALLDPSLWDNGEFSGWEARELPRHDDDLVKVVEFLGESASSDFSDLRVVEIIGGKYTIEEYDGWESVKLPSDIQWVTV